MRTRRYSREDAVDRWLFTDLYEGALRIKNREKRLAAATFLLLGGRCKLRISEIIHFHEGWLRRKYGVIEIPAFEPCYCKYCYERAKSNHKNNDPYENPLDRLTNERYRTKNKNKRFVPMGWSGRLIAAIEEYVTEIGVYQKRHKQATRLLQNHILPNAEILEPGDIDWRGIRATGETFWAFSDLNTKTRAAIGGHRETELGTYSGSSALGIINQVRETRGLEPIDFSSYDPVTDPANAHPLEPFDDPREVDPMENYNPLSTPPLFNPRSEKCPANIQVSKSDFNLGEVARREPSLERVRAVVQRYESRLEGEVAREADDCLKDEYEVSESQNDAPGQTTWWDFNN